MIFSYRSLEDLLILIFYERDFADSCQLLEINELGMHKIPCQHSQLMRCVSQEWPVFCVCVCVYSLGGCVWPMCVCVHLVHLFFFSYFLFPSSLKINSLRCSLNCKKDLKSDTRSMKAKFTLPWWQKSGINITYAQLALFQNFYGGKDQLHWLEEGKQAAVWRQDSSLIFEE